MDVKELKNIIENKTIDNSFKILLEEDEYSRIITNQYINEISKILKLNIKYIDSISNIPDDSFIEDDNLYVIIIDEWSESDEHNNCIVICKKTKDNRAIKIPKLVDWQVLDYCYSKLKGLDRSSVDSLIKFYNGNYFKFLNDVDKISIFNDSQQQFIFNEMLNENQLNASSDYTIWDLSNAIIKKDINTVRNILSIINDLDIEPLGLVKVLYNNFKTITSIQTNKNVTANDLNISDKQFYVIKKFNCGFYSNNKLIEILKLLTNVEYLYKYGEISINELIDFIIINILGEL